ncbi:hypothetical protein MUK42_37731 [Musa troglodytarum]|uniref:Uncharacterized protein n=1 Tax=Musa troglodytarum TaxID=320322 RepID=A0A9E7EBL6_9LILI|nr:hypothetical protein MUK42_37731 [Musa troglodytarum]
MPRLPPLRLRSPPGRPRRRRRWSSGHQFPLPPVVSASPSFPASLYFLSNWVRERLFACLDS